MTFRIVSLDTPVLTSISPEYAEYGSTGVVLTVTGSHFRPESVVRWNGIEMSTTFVSTTELRAEVQDRWLLEPGLVEVSVHTTIGGAGVSAPAQFRVRPQAPLITLLASQGATAARPGFALMLHGENFQDGSSIRWNGEVRAATFLEPNRLTLMLSTGDVAQPADIPVSVINIGGAESPPVTFSIRTLPSASATVTRSAVMINDIVWDPAAGLLYASLAAANGALGNTIAALDPEIGTIEKHVFVGSEPNRLALSDNGEYLYVGLDGAAAVRRVEVAPFTAGLQWSLGGSIVRDIEVVPGRPDVVAVAQGDVGLTIFEDGIARPVVAPGYVAGSTTIEFLESPDTLYGARRGSANLHTIVIDNDGARPLESAPILTFSSSEIIGAAGRIYDSQGPIVDAGRNTIVGSGGNGPAVVPDPLTGRVFYLTGDGIAIYDMNTFQLLDTIQIPDMVVGDFPRLVRSGADALAIATSTELIIVRSPILAP